ncbi:hypothetical protein [Kineothrix sedimenti]|uniref:Uncharacterized protein n=1 Tax=Kineothrix sedimenti TaxID=3123317 RepID=A0ABZ3F331_9FIRM
MSSIAKVIIVLESREDTPGADQLVSVDTYDKDDNLIESDQSDCGNYFHSEQEAITFYSKNLGLDKSVFTVEFQ